jgi:hypothetical protein
MVIFSILLKAIVDFTRNSKSESRIFVSIPIMVSQWLFSGMTGVISSPLSGIGSRQPSFVPPILTGIIERRVSSDSDSARRRIFDGRDLIHFS